MKVSFSSIGYCDEWQPHLKLILKLFPFCVCVWWFSSLLSECWRLVKDNVPSILWIFWIKHHSCHLQHPLWRQVCMLLNTRERCIYLITAIYPTELGINDTTETCRNVSQSDVWTDIDNDVKFSVLEYQPTYSLHTLDCIPTDALFHHMKIVFNRKLLLISRESRDSYGYQLCISFHPLFLYILMKQTSCRGF